MYTIVGDNMCKVLKIHLLVDCVAVAVIAITLTFSGIKILSSPSSANSLWKVSPLQIKKGGSKFIVIWTIPPPPPLD